MICNYCGKARCVHGSPEDSAHRAAVQTKVESVVVESKARSGSSLFQLYGLGTLECVLCRWVAPTGPYQPILRIQHGRIHVREGRAVETRKGLPERAVRFEVK